MADARIATLETPLNIVQVSGISASFTDLVPTTTKPTSGLLYDATQSGEGAFQQNPSLLFVTPFSSASSGSSIAMRLTGWKYFVNLSGTAYWMPTLLFQATLTYRTAGSPVPNFAPQSGQARYLFNGITPVAVSPSYSTFNPLVLSGNNALAASAVIDPIGSRLVTASFTSSGSPTMGVLWHTT